MPPFRGRFRRKPPGSDAYLVLISHRLLFLSRYDDQENRVSFLLKILERIKKEP